MTRHRDLRARLSAGLLATVVAVALALPAGAAAVPLKPDLVADPPGLNHTRDELFDTYTLPGHRLLRFDGWIHNAGPGCLQLRGSDNQNGVLVSVVQRLYEPGKCDPPDTAGFTDFPLGNGARMIYETNDSHQHFHFMAAARYSLWDEAMTREVGPASKVGFCLLDSENVDNLMSTGVFPESWSHHCNSGNPTASGAMMGLSPGWRDIYEYWLKLQWVDISDVAPGVYRVAAQMDPDNRIIEQNEINPVAFSVPIAISGWLPRTRTQKVKGLGSSKVSLRTTAIGGPSGSPELAIVARPKHGRLSRRAGQTFEAGSVSYRPRLGFHGRDSFTFVARHNGFPLNPPPAKVTLRVPLVRLLSKLGVSRSGQAVSVSTIPKVSGKLKVQLTRKGKRVDSCAKRARKRRTARCGLRIPAAYTGSALRTLRLGASLVVKGRSVYSTRAPLR